jgi:hypothetical protein
LASESYRGEELQVNNLVEKEYLRTSGRSADEASDRYQAARRRNPLPYSRHATAVTVARRFCLITSERVWDSDGFFELLGRPECHFLAGSNLHGLAGCRIPTRARLTLADFQCAKTTDTDPVSLPQMQRHPLDHR